MISLQFSVEMKLKPIRSFVLLWSLFENILRTEALLFCLSMPNSS